MLCNECLEKHVSTASKNAKKSSSLQFTVIKTIVLDQFQILCRDLNLNEDFELCCIRDSLFSEAQQSVCIWYCYNISFYFILFKLFLCKFPIKGSVSCIVLTGKLKLLSLEVDVHFLEFSGLICSLHEIFSLLEIQMWLNLKWSVLRHISFMSFNGLSTLEKQR